MYKCSFILLAFGTVALLSSHALFQQKTEIIDLSWPLENETLHWPTVPGFESKVYHDGIEFSREKNDTYYYKSDGFSMGTHVGTHLDAPIHFSNSSWTVDIIDLQRMVNVPIVVFDFSKKVQDDRAYCFQKDDFIGGKNQESFEGKVVIVYTGMSSVYSKGREEYFGTNTTDYSKMKIPGFSKEAARHLADSGAFGVGLDSASADCSKRHDSSNTMNPEAHSEFNSKNVYILENLNDRVKNLLEKQPQNYRLTIIPLKMKNFSGSPVRPIITSVCRDPNCPECPRNSAPTFKLSSQYLTATFCLIMTIFYRILSVSI